MKKFLSMMLAVILALVSCAAFAGEMTPEQFTGKWFVSQVQIDDIAYDVSESSEKTIYEFNDDGTGFVYAYSDEEYRELSWTAAPDGGTVTITGPAEDGSAAAFLAPDGESLVIRFADRTYLLDRTTDFSALLRSGMYAVYDWTVPEGADDGDTLAEAAVEVINNRLRGKGYEGAAAWLTADHGIRAEIPGVQDETVLDLISAPGKLEFTDPDGRVFMTNGMVAGAEYVYDEGDHQVVFTLTDEGSKIFAEITGANVGRKLSVRLDGELLIAPTVNDAITGGKGVINQLESRKHAETIAALITTEPLPLKLTLRKASMVTDVRGAEQAAAELRERMKDENTVVLKYGDREITKGEVQDKIREELDTAAAMAEVFGMFYDKEDPANVAEAQAKAIRALEEDLVTAAKAAELGLDQLTEEETEEARAEALNEYDQYLDYVIRYILEDTEGMDEETMNRAAAQVLDEEGVFVDDLEARIIRDRVREKLLTTVTWNVEVTDEEADAEYAARLEQGAAPEELSKEVLRETLLRTKQEQAFRMITDAWILTAGIEENLDALNTAAE